MAGVEVGSAGEDTEFALAGTPELGLQGLLEVAGTPLGMVATVGETGVTAPGGATLALVDPEVHGLATVLEMPVGVGEASGVGVARGVPI